jgi:holo-[acyl-carrier protein] synthase
MKDFGSRYLERVYTPDEIECCSRDGHCEDEQSAKRFAAKEAAAKLLELSDVAFPWTSIEVRSTQLGGSTLSLSGAAAQRAALRGVDDISVSFSHANRIASAIVVAESSEEDGGDKIWR